MAANFWASSHSKQLLDPEEVDVVPAADRERGITPVEFRLVKIHMSFHIWRLAQQVKVRQRVIATAITYFRRVYTRYSLFSKDTPHRRVSFLPLMSPSGFDYLFTI
ncbi:hypothetical protein QYE76_026104 [Lolium multiflorum]|uniref:Uncharacterized protein n=1 Tax=Lolium multiflorum TaxID=4521 RepID=A0AAD8RGM8_LOLMU|nr:hypothetical protein QYE76_026104 [Lolium multiflorum]